VQIAQTNVCAKKKTKHDDFSKPWRQKLDATAHKTEEQEQQHKKRLQQKW
jgi:hypothetical protein